MEVSSQFHIPTPLAMRKISFCLMNMKLHQCLSWPRYDGEKKTPTPALARNHAPFVHPKTDTLLISCHGSHNSDMLHTEF